MIEIITAEYTENTFGGAYWACWLEISQSGETWMLPATAPGELAEEELQAFFDAKEGELWTVAQAKQHTADLHQRVDIRRVSKAFALVALDEFNIIRAELGLSERTAEQLRAAIKAKLKQ